MLFPSPKRPPHRALHTVTMLLIMAAAPLGAATFTYDVDPTTAGVTDGFSKAWNTSVTDAWLDSGGANVAWANAADSIAVFGGGTAGTANPGPVTVGTVTANSIIFNTPNAGSYTLAGGTISLTGTTPTITANTAARIESRIVSSSLVKNGTGTLVLVNSGNSVGALTVDQGVLDVFSNLTATSVVVNGTSNLATHSGNIFNFGSLTHNGTTNLSFYAGNAHSTYTIGAGGLFLNGTGQIIISSDLNGGTSVPNPTSKIVLQGNVTATQTTKITSGGAAGGELNRRLDLDGGVRTFDVASTRTLSLEVITQNGGLVKAGAGTLVVNKVNTYDLDTAVNAGTLQLTGAGTLGAITNELSVAAGATLDLGGTDQVVNGLTGGGIITSTVTSGSLAVGSDNGTAIFSGVIQGSTASFTSLIKNGTGTQTLTGASTYSGGTTVNGGILAGVDSTVYATSGTVATGSIRKFFGTGTITLNGGTLQVRANSDGTVGTTVNHYLRLDNALVVNAASTIDVGRESGTATNKVIRFGSLSMTSTGNYLTMLSTNGYLVEVASGSIAADTTFDIRAASFTFAGKLANTTYSITKEGTGRLTLRANSMGDFIVNRGIADIYDTLTMRDVVFNNNSTLETHSGSNWNMNSLTLNTSVNMSLSAFSNSSTYTIGAGGLTMNTDTTLTVLAQNVNDGSSNPLYSRLVLQGDVDVNANAGIVRSTAGTSLGNMQLDLAGGVRTFDVAATKTFTLGIVTQNGGITKTGTGIMVTNSANTYAGYTTINEGIFRLTATGSINASTKIIVASGAQYDVSAVAAYTLTSGQSLEGGGSVTGGVTIASGAFLSPGTVGTDETQTLQFSAGLTLQSGSVTTLQLSATPTDIDHLRVSGNFLQESGAKFVVVGNGFTLAPNLSFDLLSLLGGSNTFSSNLGANLRDGSGDSGLDLDLPDIAGSGYVWDISQFTTNGIITAIAVPEPSRALLALAAMACMFGRRRRR